MSASSEDTTKIYLEIPKDLIQEPIIHTLGSRFGVVPNILSGVITETVARIALEVSGDPAEVDKAVSYLGELGVAVEPVPDDEE